MGLAAWGDPELAKQFPSIPAEVFSGVDTLVLDYLKETGFDYTKRIDEEPTAPYYAACGYWMQEVLTQALMHLARYSLEAAETNKLCMAGGVALNVVANRIIHDTLKQEGKLDSMFVQPASSDAGMPLGAALFGYYSVLEGTLPFQENLVYLGPEPDEAKAAQLLVDAGATQSDQLSSDVADLLLDEKIVGWWQGRSEYGPRALGSRSILCWPRPQGMKDHLNLQIKHREAFRPFAPIIQEERLNEVFDNTFPVPYMLFNTKVKSEYVDKIPAVTHVDGSGRLQTVSKQRTPRLHALLEEVRRRDGVGVLLNTSFNDAGEPIVETADHALDCFYRTKLDALVCGDAILTAKPASQPHFSTRLREAVGRFLGPLKKSA